MADFFLRPPTLTAGTLEFLINVPVRLLISDQFSHQYALIRTSTFIFYEQLMILYICIWTIFMKNYIFEAIILHQYAYLDQCVYWTWQNFPPVLLFGPVRLLETLEYLLSSCNFVSALHKRWTKTLSIYSDCKIWNCCTDKNTLFMNIFQMNHCWCWNFHFHKRNFI